jgi:hypothetical protein
VDKSTTAVRVRGLEPYAAYEVSVQAFDFTRNYSGFPANTTAAAATNSAPGQPAAPTVASNTLQIQVTPTGNLQAGGAMPADVSEYEVYASTTTGFTPATANMLGKIPVGPAMATTFPIPATGGGANQTWYVKIIARDIGGLASTASPQATSTPTLVAGTNIVDATITNAKIADLAVDKLTAGTGLATSFTVKSTLTLGDASNTGYIQSFDYLLNTSGWRLTKSGLEINDGSIKASAITLTSAFNNSVVAGTTVIDGDKINTGAISSNATAQVWDTSLNGGMGGYKDDPDGNLAWSINLTGTATFGNALVRGAMVIGNTSTPDVTKQGYMASATYIPGSSGWIMRADGTTEFRAVAIGSFNGAAVADGTLSAEAISGGTITSGISLAGMFETTSSPVTFNVTTTNGSPTITTSAGAFYPDDIGTTIIGAGIPVGATITARASATSVTISANATASATVSATIYRGRKVRISGADGVTLYNASGTAIVELPTDPSRPAKFSGSLFATDVHIADQFRLYGVNNSLGSGAVLQLNPGTYTPPAPALDYNWNQGHLYDQYGTTYNPSTDSYVSSPTGFKYDPVNDKYYFAFSFFGTNMVPFTKNVSVPSHYDASPSFKCDAAFINGSNDIAAGGWAQDASSFHFLTYRNSPAAGTRWLRQTITRAGINRSGGPVWTDATGSSNWYGESNDGTVQGYPSIGMYGGNLYTAKINGSGQLWFYKHSGTNTATVSYKTNTHSGFTGSLVSLEVGQFDFGTGSTYLIATWQNSAGASVAVVVRDTGAAFVDDGYSWWIPAGKNPLGVTWRTDSGGYFQAFMNDGTSYDHTKLAHTDGTASITARLAYRYDGTVGGFATSGIGSVGPDATVATLTVRRSRLVLSLPTGVTIPNTGTNSPNSLTFYAGSSTVYKFPETGTGVTSLQISELRTSNATGTAGTLVSGTASQITASNGFSITGAGDITARHITASGTGWINITMGPNVGNVGFGWTNGQAKRVGDLVYLRGLLVTSAAVAAGGTIATIPSTVYATDFAGIQLVSGVKLNTAGDAVASRFDCHPTGRVITTKLALASGEYIPVFAVLQVA